MVLLASCAMPGLLSPVELTFDGVTAQYADGCLVHTSPLGLALDCGASEVTVVFVDQELNAETAASAHGFPQTAYNIANLWQQRLLEYELRLAEATNELVRLGGATTEKRPISIRYVRPSEPIDIDLLAFDDAPALARLFDRGLADGTTTPIEKLHDATPEIPAAVTTKEEVQPWNPLRAILPRRSLKSTA
jgi:predicted acylesterase/phospholipase RssA